MTRDGGRVYLLGLAGGMVKVGRSSKYQERILYHRKRKLWRVEWTHILPPGSWAIEYQLKRAYREVSRLTAGENEVFRDLTKEAAIGICRRVWLDWVRQADKVAA